MLHIDQPDFSRDSGAARYTKDETVEVVFAEADGEILSREGINRYLQGDALVTGSTGDRWSVARDRFDVRYQPVETGSHGIAGRYRALPVPVMARQMPQAFTVSRRSGGDLLRGEAGDWLLQYAPGDFGVVEHARFLRVYRRAD
jgi:hypothetical protein